METHQSICRWEDDTLEVYTSTQYIWGVRAEIAGTLGMPADKVRVVCEFMGGGFGSKNNPGEYTFIAAELAKRSGRPVRCALTRHEEHVAAGNRNSTTQRLVIGARSDGTLTALGGEYVNDVGASGWVSMTEGPMLMLYECPNLRATTYGAELNLPPTLPFRAPGFVEGTFGLECLLDELAAKLDLDPLELRRRNHADSEPGGGRPYSGKNLIECYRRAEPHWERRHEVRADGNSVVSGWRRGLSGGPPSMPGSARSTRPSSPRWWTWDWHEDTRYRAEDRIPSITSPWQSELCGSTRRFAGSSTTPSVAQYRAGSRREGRPSTWRSNAGDDAKDIAELPSVLGTPQTSVQGRGARTRDDVPPSAPDRGRGDVELASHRRRIAADPMSVASTHFGPSSQIEAHHPGSGTRFRGGLSTIPDGRNDAKLRCVQAPDDRRRSGDRHRADRHPRLAAHEPRVEGNRRATDHPRRRCDRECNSRCNRRRRSFSADHARRDAARARRGEGEDTWNCCSRLASTT